MEFSFLISELKKSLPGTENFDALTGAELQAALRRLLGAVAANADLRVEGDLVTVTPKPVSRVYLDEAQRLYEKAGMRARKGEFEKAAGIYRRVLEIDPSRNDARRDLAMVLVEMGDTEGAKNLLLDVLKANPTDVASLVILGNHYARSESDADTAERFFRRAVELKPGDANAHNSLAGLLCEKGRNEEALAEFDKALEIRPDFPQPRYGKAMVFLDQGRLQEGKLALADMFANADLADSRNAPMLKNARDAYLKFANIAANGSAAESSQTAEEFRTRTEEVSGFKVAVVRQPLPAVQTGRSQMAWKYNRDHHLVTLAKGMPAEMLFHHILVHECHHIILEAEARAAGTNRWFISTEGSLGTALDSMRGEIRKIAKANGHDAAELEEMLRRMLPDALSLLYNGPLDILIETKIATDPRLVDAQFCSLSVQSHNALRIGLDKRTRSIVPKQLLALNDAINGANALFLDTLSSGASDYFSAYANGPAASAAREICLLCRDHAGGPGSEYDLVDQVAGILGCNGWYQWRPDPGDFEIHEKFSGNAREGLSDPAKLKQRSPAAVQLLCKALDRFDAMTVEAIKRLVVETAFAGQNGIDFTDPTPAHHLDSLPGEPVSGLEIMCILYAGMKRINPGMPDAEIGMDLAAEYATALEMRGEG